MGKLRISIGIVVLAFVAFTTVSCKNTQKETIDDDGQLSKNINKNPMTSSQIIGDYLTLKNALVADDKDAAAKAGEKLVSALENFDKSKYKGAQRAELTDIIEDATENAEHIANSAIAHQREHFDVLSKDMIDLIAIIGSEKTLYQDFCPMYNNNKGAQWLSATKEIKNPYFGSKMMSCGTVQMQIN